MIRIIFEEVLIVVSAFLIVCFLCCNVFAASPALGSVTPSAIGGAFSSLMSESFQTDLATGAATLNIPIVVPPGRKNVQPNIALSYSSNNSNGILGMGWALPVSAIQRSTKNGVPRYGLMENITSGSDELISAGGGIYYSKNESAFTKYVYSSANKAWIAYDKSGTGYYFGTTDSSRMSNPNDTSLIFAWFIDKVSDAYGNCVAYSYEKEDNSVYLKYIYYTANSSSTPALNADKRIELAYETQARSDKIYNNRSGWQQVIGRRLDKIKISIDSNRDSTWSENEIVWIYNIDYILSEDTGRSLLASIQLEDSLGNKLPAKTFDYQALEP